MYVWLSIVKMQSSLWVYILGKRINGTFVAFENDKKKRED